MRASQRIITVIPMLELWNEFGPVDAARLRDLSSDELRELLRCGPVQFVVADVGSPLRWQPQESCYEFWKHNVQSNLASPNEQVTHNSFPSGYRYFASEWLPSLGAPIVLLEVAH